MIEQSRRAAVAEFITRANYSMATGNFEVKSRDGLLHGTLSTCLGRSPFHALLWHTLQYAQMDLRDGEVRFKTTIAYTEAKDIKVGQGSTTYGNIIAGLGVVCSSGKTRLSRSRLLPCCLLQGAVKTIYEVNSATYGKYITGIAKVSALSWMLNAMCPAHNVFTDNPCSCVYAYTRRNAQVAAGQDAKTVFDSM